MQPRYPIFIPTKGRWESRFTIRAMQSIGVSYQAVIEPQEVEKYVQHGVPRENILVLPHSDKGLVVTRNWIWDHALRLGVKRFWTFDDNIQCFYRLNNNLKAKLACGNFLAAMEDFIERFENVPIAGMQYEFFITRKSKYPPFYLNTRVYSNMLIETDYRDPHGKPYRNEGFYNDDTDLCLRVLKDGNCTILFNAFLIKKIETMKVKGGMTPHYIGEGRRKMAEELAAKHPDVTTITRKWGRWQHQVDYSGFASNQLRLREGAVIPEGVNDYGMKLEIDEKRERDLLRKAKTKSLNRTRTDFLHASVQNGKSVDQAVAEWREYVAKSLETKHIENI